ncbi:MAG: outer membrane beta-barrel protein [Bacteriovoracaceae bacterium]|nr:outer membrane beta-barrel protein [Bacteriovoracaceae bacterium]
MKIKNYLLVLILTFSFSSLSFAQQSSGGATGGAGGGGYLSLDWNLDVVQSDSEFNNGASGGSPGFTLGYKIFSFSLETFYKKHELNNEHVTSAGSFNVAIETNTLGFGLRYDISPNFNFKAGYAIHNVKAKYTNSNGLLFKSTIDGTHSGFYLGAGVQGMLYPNWQMYADGGMYIASSEFSMYAMEIGVRWYSF